MLIGIAHSILKDSTNLVWSMTALISLNPFIQIIETHNLIGALLCHTMDVFDQPFFMMKFSLATEFPTKYFKELNFMQLNFLRIVFRSFRLAEVKCRNSI